MFQSNPLLSYTRNPNYETTTEEDVPNLTQSQIRLGHSNKIRNTIIWSTIGFLSILLLTIAAFSYYRSERLVWTCDDCIKLEELRSIAETSSADAISYVQRKVDHAIDANIPKDKESLMTGETLIPKIEKISQFRKKIDELLNLNSIYAKELNKALSFENDVEKLRDKYNNNLKNLKASTDQIIDYLATEFVGVGLDKQELEQEIRRIQEKIAGDREKLNEEKARIHAKLRGLENNIRDALDDANVRTDNALEELINSKVYSLENRDQAKQECEIQLPKYSEQLNAYYKLYAEELQFLEDIELQLRQSKWIEHVLKTIQGFLDIKREIELLQTNQLAAGLENLEKVVENLRKKEEEFEKISSESVSQSIKRRESRIQTDDGSKVEIYETLEETTKVVKIEDLRDLIEKEKNLLITWAWDQFSIFNISNNEIKNVTNTIQNFNESLKAEQLRDSRNYYDLKIKTEAIIMEITRNMTLTEANKKQCESAIHSTEDMIKLEEAEVERLKNIKANIQNLKEQIQNFETERNNINDEYNSELQKLEDQQKKIRALIDKSASDQKGKENELRELTNAINEVLASEPKPDVVERKFKEYREQVQNANKVYSSMNSLLEEIKSISEN